MTVWDTTRYMMIPAHQMCYTTLHDSDSDDSFQDISPVTSKEDRVCAQAMNMRTHNRFRHQPSDKHSATHNAPWPGVITQQVLIINYPESEPTSCWQDSQAAVWHTEVWIDALFSFLRCCRQVTYPRQPLHYQVWIDVSSQLPPCHLQMRTWSFETTQPL